MIRFAFRVLAVVACALRSVGDGSAQASAREYTGCYRVEQGAWVPRFTPGFHPSPERLPSIIELDPVPIPNPHGLPFLPDAFEIRSRGAPGERVHRFEAWRLGPDGSLLIGVSGLQLVGFDLRVARVDGELRGHVRAFTDVASYDPPSEVSAPVRLMRVPCDPLPWAP